MANEEKEWMVFIGAVLALVLLFFFAYGMFFAVFQKIDKDFRRENTNNSRSQ